jgi:4-aminobutyrate aminotransferase/(S)-3-amino-2-methylpropionate transaminase
MKNDSGDTLAGSLAARARQNFMPCASWWYGDDPLVVASAQGSTITDVNGRQFLDIFGQTSVVNTGYCHPKVVERVQQQVAKLTHCTPYMFVTDVSVELAEKMIAFTPEGLEVCFFGNSGTEAVELALFLAKQSTGRYEIISLYGGFHGRTMGSLSVTSIPGRKKGRGPMVNGTVTMPGYNCYRCPFGLEYPSCGLKCAKHLEDVLKFQSGEEVAAFIAEPVQGTAGIVVPPKEYFSEIKTILDKHGILFISDEVQTGMGRTGKRFAIEHFGVQPDILTVSKGLASGLPLGATVARREVAAALKPHDYYSTFGGNPVSCAAASANIDILVEEDLPGKAATMGAYFMERLFELQEAHTAIGQVSGLGLLLGLDLVVDRTTKEPARDLSMHLRTEAYRRGLIVGAGMGVDGNVVRISPPLNITRAEVDEAVRILDESLTALGA